MKSLVSKRKRNGQSMIEYALILALISIFIILVMNIVRHISRARILSNNQRIWGADGSL